MEQPKKLPPALAALIVVVLVAIVASVAIVIANNNDNATQSGQTTQSDSSGNATVDATDTSAYKDGTYSATGTYLSPGGRESIELTVTLKDGEIIETSAIANAASTDSRQYQNQFVNNYQSLVVGKKINGLSLTRVAGSSLTSNGFNDALEAIRDESRA